MADETTGKAVEVSSSQGRLPTPAEQRAKAHAGSTDTDQLVNDIAQTRQELAVTIDAIVDRVSPKKVVERGKQQAREGVHDATVIVKGHASTAAEVVREKALVAGETLKTTAAQVREKVSGATGSTPVRSALAPAGSVAVGSARLTTSSPSTSASSSVGTPAGPSPLPAGTVSVDTGELPPPEPVATTGALADAADASGPSVEPAGSDLPPVRALGPSAPAVPPVYAGAGVAALVAAVLLVLRRRRRRRPGRRR